MRAKQAENISTGVRFAPSPTGHFHIGNLRTAWISWFWAQKLSVPWVVRFEDIDTPRVLDGARESQLADMAALGLIPDQLFDQSSFRERHLNLFRRAVHEGRVYPCDCSRKEVQSALAGIASAPHEAQPPVYSGHCRSLAADRKLNAQDTIAWRFRMPDETGNRDFIVARTSVSFLNHDRSMVSSVTDENFTPAYHWACAIDDYDGGYALLVRSWDLAPALELQRAIHLWLCEIETFRAPAGVFHTSLLVNRDGSRLEKRTKGVRLSELFAQGETSHSILQKFEESFRQPDFVISGSAVWGEPQRKLSLEYLVPFSDTPR